MTHTYKGQLFIESAGIYMVGVPPPFIRNLEAPALDFKQPDSIHHSSGFKSSSQVIQSTSFLLLHILPHTI